MLWELLMICSFARFWYEIGYNAGLHRAERNAERMLDQLKEERPTGPRLVPKNRRG
jgi:hypothetical protein